MSADPQPTSPPPPADGGAEAARPASAERRRHWRRAFRGLGRSPDAPPLASALTPTLNTLLFGAALLVLGSSLLSITLPLRLEASGVPAGRIGPILACFFVGMLLGTRAAPRLVSSVGHVRAFAGCAATFAAAVVVHALLPSLLVWAALRVVAGFSLACLYAVIESWMHETATNSTRGRVHGAYSTVFFAASGGGMLLASAVDFDTAQPFLLATLLVALCLVPISLTRVAQPDLPSFEPLGWRELHAVSPAAIVGAIGSGVIAGSFYAIGPVHARAVGLGIPATTAFMATAIVGGLLVQRLVAAASDKFDRRRVLLVVLAFTVAECAVGASFDLLGLPLWSLFVVALLHGVPVATIYPLSVAQAYDRISRERLVAAASRLLGGYSVGAIAGPVVTGAAVETLGAPAFFGAAGVVALLLLAHLVTRMLARPALPAEAQAPYVLLRPSSPVTATLDPRVPGPAVSTSGAENVADGEDRS